MSPSPVSRATISRSRSRPRRSRRWRTDIAKRFKLDAGPRARAGAACRRRLRLEGDRWGWRPSRPSRSPKPPARRCGSLISRHEELSVAGYRPAVELKLALLPSRDGGLKALSLTAYSDAGVAANNTVAGLARLIYKADAKALRDYDVISDLPPGSPFRGPGGPPMAFALEQAIDEAALRLGVDPLALRKRWDANPTRGRLYDWAMALDVWKTRGQPHRRRPLPARRRRGGGLLALSLADRHAGQARRRGRPPRRGTRGAGHRHRHAHGDRRHAGARVRPRAAGDRGAARRFPAAARPRLRRQPRHGLHRAGAAGRLGQAEGARCRLRARPRRRAPTRPGAICIAAAPDLSVVGRPPRGRQAQHLRPRLAAARGRPRRPPLRLDAAAAADTWRSAPARRVRCRWSRSRSTPGSPAFASCAPGPAFRSASSPRAPLARNQAAGAFVQSLGHALYEGREIDRGAPAAC